jgi:hypothetical protein
MRKEIVILLCTFIIASLIGCGLPYQTKSQGTYTIANASYDISLISVERSTGAKKIYGEQRIEAVIEEGISRSFFEDEMVRIKWRPTPDDIGLFINNKTDASMKIVWDEARFVDEKGISHRLIHSGIGYEERNDSHPPTVVAARSTLDDFIHPADYFRQEESYGSRAYKQQSHWERSPFLPTQIKGNAEELRAKAEPFAGKTFQVLLPIQIENVRHDYLFTFKINKVNVTEEKHEQEKSTDNKGKGKRSGRGMRL